MKELEKLAKVSGLLDVIDDALQQILEAQFGLTEPEWFRSIQKLEEGYAATKGYVARRLRSHKRG